MERPFLTYILIAAGILVAAVIRAYLKKRSRLTGLFRFAGGVEVTFIALLLFSLIFFGCLQIILRNFYHRGILWADPLMRHIVLWLGCLGAAFATTKMRHINIDVFTRFLPPVLMRIRNKIIFLATAIAASILGFAALKLVIDEKSFGEEAFLGVDVWLLQLVLPVAFFLISYRSLLNMMVPPEVSPVEWDDFGVSGGEPAEGGGSGGDPAADGGSGYDPAADGGSGYDPAAGGPLENEDGGAENGGRAVDNDSGEENGGGADDAAGRDGNEDHASGEDGGREDSKHGADDAADVDVEDVTNDEDITNGRDTKPNGDGRKNDGEGGAKS